MIKFILRKMLRNFGKTYDYDTTYMLEVADIWPGAALRYLGLTAVSQMKGPVPEVWAGAALASTLDGDCGPCAQLIVDMALKAGVDEAHIIACLARDFAAAGPAGLGFRFAEAAISGDIQADSLRDEIRAAHGEKAVIACAYAAASGRAYPVMKRALGHGKACQQITLGEAYHPIVKMNA
jgi:hypothetical protein